MIGRSRILAWFLCSCRQCRHMRPGDKRRVIHKAKRAEKKLWRKDWEIK